MLSTMPRLGVILICFLVLIAGLSCGVQSEMPDTILINGEVYTMDSTRSTCAAIAVRDGKIIALGNTAEISAMASEQTEVIDVSGAFVIPGLIEGHGHFSGLGQSLMNLNFLKSKSWEEIVQMVEERVKETPYGE
ncbi:MAG: amidohydrolase, partial [Bacteroidota bacterium]